MKESPALVTVSTGSLLFIMADVKLISIFAIAEWWLVSAPFFKYLYRVFFKLNAIIVAHTGEKSLTQSTKWAFIDLYMSLKLFTLIIERLNESYI